MKNKPLVTKYWGYHGPKANRCPKTYSNLRLAAARLEKLQKIVLGLFVGVLVISG